MAAVGVPVAGEIAGRERDLVVGSADSGAVADPVGVRGEEVGDRAGGVAAVGQQFLLGQMFFAAAARVVEFNARVVADGGEVAAVEESAGVGELGALVAILEAAAGVADVEGEVELVARSQRSFELVDGVEGARDWRKRRGTGGRSARPRRTAAGW